MAAREVRCVLNSPKAPQKNPQTATRIAVIDDDVRFLRMVERMLGMRNMEVVPVTTPDIDEMVSVVGSEGCGAAVVDLYLYGEPMGFDIVYAMRHDYRTHNLPVVLSTGAMRDVIKSAGYLESMRCAVLAKPFEEGELVAKLRAARQALVEPAPVIDPGGDQGHSGGWRRIAPVFNRLRPERAEIAANR